MGLRCTLSVGITPEPTEDQLQSILDFLINTKVGASIGKEDLEKMFNDSLDDIYYAGTDNIREMLRTCSETFHTFSFRILVHLETNYEEGIVILVKNGKIANVPSWLEFLESKISPKVLSQWKQKYSDIETTTLNTM
jgi:hypothetical protein